MPVSLKNPHPSQGDIASFVADFASRFSLKAQTVKGNREYRGANPVDPQGSTSIQFALRENGTGYDHKLKQAYTLRALKNFLESGSTSPIPTRLAPAPRPKRQKPGWDWNAPFQTFGYVTEQGQTLFEVLRQGDGAEKNVLQRRPNPDSEGAKKKPWLYSLGNTTRVLYGLPDVIRAEFVLVVEGEKAAECINAKLREFELFPRFVATTSPEGAGKNIQCFPGRVQGKTVYIFPDNDEPGEKHARMVAIAVSEVAKATKIVDLPGALEKWGADDWLGNERAVGELIELAEATAPFIDDKPDGEPDAKRDFDLDDIGNGERFAAEHSADLRFCSARECWLVYKAGVWKVDDQKTAEARAKQTARRAWADARTEKDEEKRMKLSKHAMQLAGSDKRSTMLRDASSEPNIVVSPSQFDTSPDVFNCANGVLDLNTFEFREHSERDLSTLQSPAKFDPAARCPLWEKSLRMWQPDEQVQDYLQRSTGLTMSGTLYDEYFNFLFGQGENGKSRFLGALELLMGSYFHKTPAETLMAARDARQAEAPQPAVLMLKGARLVSSHEIDETHRFNAALIKDLTGRDAITARGIREKRSVTFDPQFSLWLYGNGKPLITDTSDGMWRRVRLIEFAHRVRDEERDPLLGEKFKAELSGILNWALEGLKRARANGLPVPDSIKAATESYREEQDPLRAFIHERCELGGAYTVTNAELWKEWKGWAEENGEHVRSAKFITQNLKRHKCDTYVSGGTRGARGIRLKRFIPENVSQASQVSQEDEKATLATDATLIPGKESSGESSAQGEKRMGRHADSEPYAMSKQTESGLFER